jgi:hypothetical protein
MGRERKTINRGTRQTGGCVEGTDAGVTAKYWGGTERDNRLARQRVRNRMGEIEEETKGKRQRGDKGWRKRSGRKSRRDIRSDK